MTQLHPPPPTSILIIGAGTWGISTAYHLSLRQHPDPASIVVLDCHAVPSPISAGNDINKILDLSPGGTAAETLLYKETMKGWKLDPVFKEFFHDTGMVIAASSKDGLRHVQQGDGIDDAKPGEWTYLDTAEEFRATMPEGVLTGDFPAWRGWWKKSGGGAGWVEARNALLSASEAARRRGVKFITGEQAGRVTELIIEEDDVCGARTADGVEHRAEKTVVCAGANVSQIEPLGRELKGMLLPKAWTLAHIKLSGEERGLYKGLPVLFNCERGFFTEPDSEEGEIKICDEHPGYCNWVDDEDGEPQKEDGRVDLPFARQQIPQEAEDRVRLFLRETMPHLAKRELSFARICWCADTPDREFLICRHPNYQSLTLGIGGSGHGFVYISCIGHFIVDAMEEKLDEGLQEMWRWRPETAKGRDWGNLQGRYGPKGSNRVMDLGTVKEWTHLPSRLRVNANGDGDG